MQLEEVYQMVKSNGGRFTKVRRAVIEILFSASQPLSALDIIQNLKEIKILVNRTTVYRELLYLVENDIVKEIKFKDNLRYFEISQNHHHHLVCTNCHTIKEITLGDHLEKQEKHIWRKEKFKVIDHALEFYGLCKKCVD